MHGYLSMFSHLIHDSEESLESERAMRLIYKDTPGQMNSVNANVPNWKQQIAGFDFTNEGNALVNEDNFSNHGLYQRYRYNNRSQNG